MIYRYKHIRRKAAPGRHVYHKDSNPDVKFQFRKGNFEIDVPEEYTHSAEDLLAYVDRNKPASDEVRPSA